MTVVYGSQLDVQEVMVLEASVSPKTSECVISKIALEITPIRLPLPFVSFIINWKGIPLERNLFFLLYVLPFFPVFHLNPPAVTDADMTSCADSFRHSINLMPI